MKAESEPKLFSFSRLSVGYKTHANWYIVEFTKIQIPTHKQ
jgi:hypothetical protein